MCQEISDHIGQRMEGSSDKPDRTMEVLKEASIFDTADWPTNKDDLTNYGNNEINHLCEHFSLVLGRMGADQTKIREEWTQAKAMIGSKLLQTPKPKKKSKH